MIRVLVICLAPQRVPDQILLAKSLEAEGGFEFLFVCSLEVPSKVAARIPENGFRALLLDPSGGLTEIPHSPSASHSVAEVPGGFRAIGSGWKGRGRRFLKSLAQWSTLSQVILARRLMKRLERLKSGADRVIADFRPGIVLAIGDRHGDIEAAFAKSAREKRIPVVIPYLAYSDMASLVSQRMGNMLHSNPFHSPLYYKWVYWKHRNMILSGMLYHVPYQVVAYGKFGALPTNPWTFGCGISDVVCVDNLSTLERYVSYGVAPSKLRVIGDAVYDSLFRHYNEKDSIIRTLRERWNLRADRKTVMVALPQLAEHDLLPWDRHFQEIEFLMGTLAGLDCNLVVSLHPKQDRSRYAYLEARYGCSILDGRLADWLVAADVFVATYSSTVMWAVLYGIPVVVVDFYGLDSTMFDFLTTPSVVKKHEDFPAAMHGALSREIDFTPDWRRLSRETVFDGRTTARYAALLEELTEAGAS